MKEHLARIASTTLLCGALGLGLYAALAEAARFPELTSALLGLVCSTGLLVLLACEIADALRTGIVPSRPFPIDRDKEPAWFWGALLFGCLCLLLLLWLFVYGTARLAILATGDV